jgi:heme/copper-type cytochrome/quinol oxidase subunit 2
MINSDVCLSLPLASSYIIAIYHSLCPLSNTISYPLLPENPLALASQASPYSFLFCSLSYLLFPSSSSSYLASASLSTTASPYSAVLVPSPSACHSYLQPLSAFYFPAALTLTLLSATLCSASSAPSSALCFADSYSPSLSSHNTYSAFYMTLFSAYLVLPLYSIINFYILSFDVIHSFGYHSFGFKSDAIPGRVNSVSSLSLFVPGLFSSYCYELCGLSHTSMLSAALVL